MIVLNFIKINLIEIIDYVWKKSLKVVFDCSGIKKMDIFMLFFVQYYEIRIRLQWWYFFMISCRNIKKQN